jgi:hypothetical protein
MNTADVEQERGACRAEDVDPLIRPHIGRIKINKPLVAFRDDAEAGILLGDIGEVVNR